MAALLAKKHIYLNVVNDRSFGKLSDVPAKLLSDSSSTASTFSFLLNRGQWNRDVAKDYLSIPKENRIHFYVDHKAGRGDGVIPHAASLHQALENAEKGKKVKKEDKEKKVATENCHKLFSTKLSKEVGGHCLSRHELIDPESGKTQYELYSEFVKSVTMRKR